MENQSNTFQMYHGGVKWTRLPREILGSSKNRYEHGVGIYFTNFYQTARKYARGSNVVHLVDIDKNFVDIKEVELKLDDVISFVSGCYGMKSKSDIISDLRRNADRRSVDFIHANTLNNLIVNYEAGAGKVGLRVIDFFVSNGIDGSLIRQSGTEVWMVVFNPFIIKKVKIVSPSTIDSNFQFELPI